MSAARAVAAALCALPLFVAAEALPPAKPAAPVPPRELKIYQTVMPRYEGLKVGSDGGCVTLQFQIRHTGFVGDVKVLEARPEALAEPTVAAIKQWVFQSFPANEAEVSATQTFVFSPEHVRLPDNAIRSSYATLGEGGTLSNTTCGARAKAAAAGGKK